MSTSTPKITALAAAIEARLPGVLERAPSLPDELCYEVQPDKLKEVCLALRDSPELKFEIDYDPLQAGADRAGASATPIHRRGFSPCPKTRPWRTWSPTISKPSASFPS